jgi:toxin ParE1/3/4
MRYEFHPEAEQELYEAAARYESEVSDLGLRFADEVESVVRLLLEHPELGSKLDNELRHFVLRRFPFSIVYAVVSNVIWVVAVAHGSREPGYWRLRVQER